MFRSSGLARLAAILSLTAAAAAPARADGPSPASTESPPIGAGSPARGFADRDGEAGAPSAKPWTASLIAGYGASYDRGGLALELRRGHWAGFVALGADLFTAPPESGPRGRAYGSLALGVRWFSGEGEHLVLTAHALGTAWDSWQTHQVGQQGRALLGATAGWRQRFGDRFFAQAAAGVAGQWERYDVRSSSARPVQSFRVVPDLDAGLGMTF